MTQHQANDASSQAQGGTSSAVRDALARALQLDLVGPVPGLGDPNEILPAREVPSTWYLTGFLVPACAAPEQRRAFDEDDTAQTAAESAGVDGDEEAGRPARPSLFPSSIGMTFLVAPGSDHVEVTVRWGDYARVEAGELEGVSAGAWRRTPHERRLHIGWHEGAREQTLEVPDSRGLQLVVQTQPVASAQLPEGTTSVSVFLVNRRPDAGEESRAFQASVEVHGARFVARPDLRAQHFDDWDESVAQLHYADTPSYAAGHNVSVEWDVEGGRCTAIRTAWIPRVDVPATVPVEIEGVETSMDVLGHLPDGEAAQAALGGLVRAYRAWIDAQQRVVDALDGRPRQTGRRLVSQARAAAARIERGIAALRDDPDALDAFRVANRAVARALRQRLGIEQPRWRIFQLAFVLLNVAGLCDPSSEDREIVDLLFFPTGGGKTEAYLGLAAMAMVLRRLRRPQAEARAGAGVAVLMRYTLRLLTIDQLVRAAGLVCALELERAEDPQRYGAWPFEIGIWVGMAATPNRLGQRGDKSRDTARARLQRFQADSQANGAPIPLDSCPWCGAPFEPSCFRLVPNADRPRNLVIYCADLDCPFSRERPVPVVAVDECIYRRLPAFLIATADKFAALPWTGPSGMLLGGATRYDEHGFYGPTDPYGGRALPQPLAPPDLVVQDELHLIAGPLGTLAALYETAIEGLMIARSSAGRPAAGGTRPKIVASTATVRYAREQVEALFGRHDTRVFPPPGPSRHDSFFARTAPLDEYPGRRYVGVCAPGRSVKATMRRVFLTVLGASMRAYLDAGGDANPNNPADPYMTLLAYFNALRELGGARRILEEEVQSTAQALGARKRVGEPRGLLADRKLFSEVLELTSRVPLHKVARTRRRIGAPYRAAHVDWTLATNMISVGLDVPRLGLMVVVGQPKTHAEYIQATSRVGRTRERPGLVVTVLNPHRPRDRSHYERFIHYHRTFYRAVEGGYVTPFSARALDRALAGVLVALARHLIPDLTPPDGVMRIAEHRAALERQLSKLFSERLDRHPFADEQERAERKRSVASRITDLFEAWEAIVAGWHQVAAQGAYQRHEGRSSSRPAPLLRDMLEQVEDPVQAKFRALRSLRDVEPEVALFVRPLS